VRGNADAIGARELVEGNLAEGLDGIDVDPKPLGMSSLRELGHRLQHAGLVIGRLHRKPGAPGQAPRARPEALRVEATALGDR
jgi:hypothetical protein